MHQPTQIFVASILKLRKTKKNINLIIIVKYLSSFLLQQLNWKTTWHLTILLEFSLTIWRLSFLHYFLWYQSFLLLDSMFFPWNSIEVLQIEPKENLVLFHCSIWICFLTWRKGRWTWRHHWWEDLWIWNFLWLIETRFYHYLFLKALVILQT